MFFPKPIHNYRDWLKADSELWRHYWFAMVNRGVMAQPYWWDEQWTVSIAHTDADVDRISRYSQRSPLRLRRRKKSRMRQPAARTKLSRLVLLK